MRNRLSKCVLTAEQIIKDEKLGLPIDLTELAKRHEIILQPKPISAKKNTIFIQIHTMFEQDMIGITTDNIR